MFKKLEELETRYNGLERDLSLPEVISDQSKYQKIAKEHRGLRPLIEKFREYRNLEGKLRDARDMLKESDSELKALAQEEVIALGAQMALCTTDLKKSLVPRDPNDDKNVLLEIRAGTGGGEAALFAQDIFRMYSRYAESKGWKVEIISSSPTGIGGFREIISMIDGNGVYSRLKYESGVHRVQRVPVTEASGRIHTSAVTVAILPEADEVEITIDSKDLRVDTFCSSGPGGQSVNTTYSAVRITHIPSNIVVQCQDERSWQKNKAKAMIELRSRIYAIEHQKYLDEIGSKRKTMVSTGDRSAKIRTYNYPQGRMTDHRIGLTLYNLPAIMDGDIGEIIEKLRYEENAERLKETEL